MKLNRTEAREKIMIILYQIDLYDKDKIPYDLESVFHENLEIDNKFVRDIVDGVLEKKDSIDKIISKYLLFMFDIVKSYNKIKIYTNSIFKYAD